MPQDTKVSLFKFSILSRTGSSPPSFDMPSPSISLPLMAFSTVLGCSYISFNIKCLKPAFSSSVYSQSIVSGSFAIFFKFKSVIVTLLSFNSAISSSFKYITLFVYLIKAFISDAAIYSFSPIPTMIGLPLLATIIFLGKSL